MKKKYASHQEYLRALKASKRNILLIRIGILLFAVGLWQLLASTGVIDSFMTSSPSRILDSFNRLIQTKAFRQDIGITLLECMIGFAVSTVVGTLIAVILWWFEPVRKVLEPYIVILNSLPKIALGPIIIIWVGSGMPAIITMTVLISVIITIISMVSAFRECDEDKITLLKSMGASKMQIFLKLVLPQAVPGFLSVLKINVGLSWVGTIMGEFLSSGKGLGYQIVYGGTVFQYDLVMMCTVVLCLLAAGMYLLVSLVERLIIRLRS